MRRQLGPLVAGACLLGLTLALAVGCSAAPNSGGSGDSGGPGSTTALVTVTPAPKHPPVRPSGPGVPPIGGGGIKPHLNAVPAFTTDDMATFVKNNPLPGNLGAGGASPTITRAEFLSAGDLAKLLGTSAGRPASALLGFVEMKGDFAIAAGASGGKPPTFPYAYAVFDAQTGNLLLFGGLDGPSAAATPVPTTAPKPTAIPTAGPAPKLDVSPSGTTYVNCGALPIPYPQVTVRNAGGQTLTWQASATNAQAHPSPASGSLGAGQSQTMAVSQTSGGGGTDVHFTSNGGNVTISFQCNVG